MLHNTEKNSILPIIEDTNESNTIIIKKSLNKIKPDRINNYKLNLLLKDIIILIISKRYKNKINDHSAILFLLLALKQINENDLEYHKTKLVDKLYKENNDNVYLVIGNIMDNLPSSVKENLNYMEKIKLLKTLLECRKEEFQTTNKCKKCNSYADCKGGLGYCNVCKNGLSMCGKNDTDKSCCESDNANDVNNANNANNANYANYANYANDSNDANDANDANYASYNNNNNNNNDNDNILYANYILEEDDLRKKMVTGKDGKSYYWDIDSNVLTEIDLNKKNKNKMTLKELEHLLKTKHKFAINDTIETDYTNDTNDTIETDYTNDINVKLKALSVQSESEDNNANPFYSNVYFQKEYEIPTLTSIPEVITEKEVVDNKISDGTNNKIENTNEENVFKGKHGTIIIIFIVLIIVAIISISMISLFLKTKSHKILNNNNVSNIFNRN